MTEVLSQNQIKNLLASPEPPFKDIGLHQLAMGWPGTIPLTLEHMIECPARDLKTLNLLLTQRAPFLRKCFGKPRGLDRNSYIYFDRFRKELEIFLASLREVMALVPGPRRRDFLRRLAGFSGVAGEVRALTEQLWSPDDAAFFQGCSDRARRAGKRQFMIFLSYHCNLSCPYCFAEGLPSSTLPLPRVLALLDWMKANQAQEVTFCGGEPTLYPHFPEVLDAVSEQGWKTYFATNLLGPDPVIKKLTPDPVRALIVHVAPRDAYAPDQWERLRSNLRRVRDQGVKQGLRINMYKKDGDFEHVLAVSRETGIKEVQFALAFPSVNRDNSFIGFDQFQEFVAPVLQLKRTLEQEKIRFMFSKPIPLCLFPEAEREQMVQESGFPPACSVFDDDFTHNACISPDENVSPCLALLDVTRPFPEIPDWNALASFGRREIMPLLDLALFDHCPDCFLFERRSCQGACLSLKKIKQTG